MSAITHPYAGVPVSDLDASIDWCTPIFGRHPDMRAGEGDPLGHRRVAEGHVVGAIQVQSDGVIQAHVSMLLIDREWRGHQLGCRLLREELKRAGGLRLDILTRTEGYYQRLGASRTLVFRLTPDAFEDVEEADRG